MLNKLRQRFAEWLFKKLVPSSYTIIIIREPLDQSQILDILGFIAYVRTVRDDYEAKVRMH